MVARSIPNGVRPGKELGDGIASFSNWDAPLALERALRPFLLSPAFGRNRFAIEPSGKLAFGQNNTQSEYLCGSLSLPTQLRRRQTSLTICILQGHDHQIQLLILAYRFGRKFALSHPAQSPGRYRQSGCLNLRGLERKSSIVVSGATCSMPT